MNKLTIEQREAVISALVEGCSIRATAACLTGVHRDTVRRLMARGGEGCEWLTDAAMQDLACQRIQMDEIWTFVSKKQRHLKDSDDPARNGEVWTFVVLGCRLLATFSSRPVSTR